MDTILDNIPIDMFVSDIEENKPIENQKRENRRHVNITVKKLHGDGNLMGLTIIDHSTRIIMQNM